MMKRLNLVNKSINSIRASYKRRTFFFKNSYGFVLQSFFNTC